ncbi:MAG: FRG domain-containing protein [Muribaculaceae bacterium]|nr:FRG domain-containing protein [Muribaculaceae bacterium]
MDMMEAERLLDEFIGEAERLAGGERVPIRVIVDDFPYSLLPYAGSSCGRIYPPMVPMYDDGELLVVRDWLKAVVEEAKPNMMRSLAAYYVYGFRVWRDEGRKILPPPMDADAMAFSLTLMSLSGVPLWNGSSKMKSAIEVTAKRYTGMDCRFVRTCGADGETASMLGLDEEGNRRKYQLLHSLDMASASPTFVRGADKGSRDNPFSNIDEAVAYIEELEQDAIANDPFMHSEFVDSSYHYRLLGEVDIDSGKKALHGSFCQPWAEPYCAHRVEAPGSGFVVSQLNPFNVWDDFFADERAPRKAFSPRFSLKPSLRRKKFLYRGQSKEYFEDGKPTCKANIYRKDAVDNPLPYLIKSYEEACLASRHPLALQLGVKGVRLFNEDFTFQLNMVGLAQHYYNRTNLLDLTSDVEVARFFATSKYNNDTDSYSAIEGDNGGELGIIYVYEIKMPMAFQPHPDYHLSTIGKQFTYMRSGMQSGFLLDLNPSMELHDLPHVHRFYFRHDAEISRRIFENAEEGKKYFPDDELSRHWSALRKAPNGDLTISKKARELYMLLHKGDFATVDELDRKLLAEGFRLSDELWPEFPPELLDSYYASMADGKGWRDFCRDIHFIGAEGRFMKQALERLPEEIKYSKAFRR